MAHASLSGLRVVQVLTRMNIGGPAQHVLMLDDCLRVLGCQVHVVHGHLGPCEAGVRGRLRSQLAPAWQLKTLGPRVHPWRDLLALVALVRFIWRTRPDVVHTHTSKAGALGRTAAALCNLFRARTARCLIVHTFHGNVMSGYFGALGSAAVRTIERLLGLLTDRAVTLSARQTDELVRRLRVVPRGRITEIPLAVRADEFWPREPDAPSLRPDLGVPPKAVVFGYAGRLVPVKSLELLVAAFARVKESVPEACLVLAGDGPCRERLRHEVVRSRLDGSVWFAGWQDDLQRMYHTFDVAVLTSSNEGTPLFLLEAMAAGVPVVATAVGGVPDVVRHGVTGLLVPAGDVVAIAEAMRMLAADPAARERLGRAARDEVTARYGAERLTEQIGRLYLAGLAEKRLTRTRGVLQCVAGRQ